MLMFESSQRATTRYKTIFFFLLKVLLAALIGSQEENIQKWKRRPAELRVESVEATPKGFEVGSVCVLISVCTGICERACFSNMRCSTGVHVASLEEGQCKTNNTPSYIM